MKRPRTEDYNRRALKRERERERGYFKEFRVKKRN
jgi:hypothetical protein